MDYDRPAAQSITYLTQLTQSEWALFLCPINLPEKGSNNRILFLSHATPRTDLQKTKV